MPSSAPNNAILSGMKPELQDRLLELLQHDAEEVFDQGLEMLRAGEWTPLDRYLIARALCGEPIRAIAVMADDQGAAGAMERRYIGRCLERLAAREALTQREPPQIFYAHLPALLADRPAQSEDAAAAAALREACRQLRARGRIATMFSADPARYSGIRLLEILADVLEGIGRPLTQMRTLVRQLSMLEPRGLAGHEERARLRMCRESLEETLLESCDPGQI